MMTPTVLPSGPCVTSTTLCWKLGSGRPGFATRNTPFAAAEGSAAAGTATPSAAASSRRRGTASTAALSRRAASPGNRSASSGATIAHGEVSVNKKLLVPVDGSEHSLNAVRYAIGRVREAPAELLVLHVEPPVSYEEMRVYVMREEAEKIRRQACERVLASATVLLDKAKVAYSAHLREGEIAPTIAKFAQAEEVDEVIIGTRGMGAVGELLLGSVAHRVVHLVQVPVTLVR